MSRRKKKTFEVCLGKQYVNEIGSFIENTLKNWFSKFKFYSLALDESTDVTDMAQIVTFLCGVDEAFNVKEELAVKELRETTQRTTKPRSSSVNINYN